MNVLALLSGGFGVAIVAIVLWDALETILVPRRIGRRVRLTRYFYIVTWRLWRAWALAVRKPSRRESGLGAYGPLSLVGLLVCWAGGLVLGFAFLQLAADAAAGVAAGGLLHLLYLSGETFFTLGFGDVTPPTALGRAFAVFEAGLGFGFLGTVVGYLPTMYSGFAQREVEISLMDARAGSPPTAAEFLRRTGERGLCDAQLHAWERWAAQLLETHISYPQLAYYRSQHVNQSWLASLTAILDASALLIARERGRDGAGVAQARLTFAMARHALVDITQTFVPRWLPGAVDRLPGERLAALRARLADTPNALPVDAVFEHTLADLRLLYEPYAQALAAFLLFELPPWLPDAPKRDNWQGGPWDRQLGAQREHTHADEEHF